MLNPKVEPIFDYETAFQRNLGWLTSEEQALLRTKTVSIAGMGGVGGIHLLTLARLGVTRFKIADCDHFELANFNRQVGATMQTLGLDKVDVLARMAQDINPDIHIDTFNEGLPPENISSFLENSDLYIDGLDFFQLPIRRQVFATCYEKKIPGITAAPLGMGTAYLIFMPGEMCFEEYFQFKNKPERDQFILFLLGLSPKGLHQSYLVDPTTLDLNQRKGPSTFMACELCAGVTGVEALKILLDRGTVYPAPYYHLFDAYQSRYILKKLCFGNQNPLQQLKFLWIRRALNRKF